jgi:hypothetical protein
MEEITLNLDDEIADWLTAYAAEKGKSASEIVGKLIRERRESDRAKARILGRRILASRDSD